MQTDGLRKIEIKLNLCASHLRWCTSHIAFFVLELAPRSFRFPDFAQFDFEKYQKPRKHQTASAGVAFGRPRTASEATYWSPRPLGLSIAAMLPATGRLPSATHPSIRHEDFIPSCCMPVACPPSASPVSAHLLVRAMVSFRFFTRWV